VKLLSVTSIAAMLISAGCATAVTQSTDDGPPPSGDAGAKPDSGTPKKTPDGGTQTTQDSGSTTGDDAAPPLDDSTCAATSTKADCEQCCLKVHPTGYDTYRQTLDSCVCTSPGDCAADCATEVCANQPTTTGDACESCITASLTQGTGSCYDAVNAACGADVDCTALFSTCIPPCESK